MVIVGLLTSTGVALADPPWAGGDRDRHEDRNDHERKGDDRWDRDRGHEDRREDRRENRREYFNEQHRVVIREYYDERYRSGHCPPGLARKHNGCMPPGQARRWHIGERLPRDVVYYEVPRDVVVRLGPPPSGHRYVRVASDILLLAIGTGMVVDAIEDLDRR
ncbi:MAG: hypothetical protein EPO06_05305 [Burkholderiaceae bacterium]|nr:MAG: hypothetical protein EPO06_05305 [Burkholderiaceae bacterium]